MHPPKLDRYRAEIQYLNKDGLKLQMEQGGEPQKTIEEKIFGP